MLLVPKFIGIKCPATLGDMVIPMDYNDAGAVDPDPGIIFYNQLSVDRHLEKKGATSFKHVNEVVASLPSFILHDVELSLAAGVHRPSGSSEFVAAFGLSHEPTNYFSPSQITKVGLGNVRLSGPEPSQYTQIVAPLAIQSHVVGSSDPSLTFSGTPFLGLDLRGLMCILSTGQATIIHDHDDSTLHVMAVLSPEPVDGTTTAFVGRPAAILRNSLDDSSRAYSTCVQTALPQALTNMLVDVQIDSFGATFALRMDAGGDSHAWLLRVIVDYEYVRLLGGSTSGRGIQLSGVKGETTVYMSDSSVFGAPANPPGGQLVLSFGGTLILWGCYIGRCTREGITVSNGDVQMFGAVVEQCGSSSGYAAWVLGAEATIGFLDYPGLLGGAKLNLFRNCPNVGIQFDDRGSTSRNDIQKVQFENNTGPCVLVRKNAIIDHELSTDGFCDAGGNLDVGIEVEGPGAHLTLASSNDVSGAAGDLRVDGVLVTYAEVEAVENLVTDLLNVVSK